LKKGKEKIRIESEGKGVKQTKKKKRFHFQSAERLAPTNIFRTGQTNAQERKINLPGLFGSGQIIVREQHPQYIKLIGCCTCTVAFLVLLHMSSSRERVTQKYMYTGERWMDGNNPQPSAPIDHHQETNQRRPTRAQKN
jgi:hypothetical protein